MGQATALDLRGFFVRARDLAAIGPRITSEVRRWASTGSTHHFDRLNPPLRQAQPTTLTGSAHRGGRLLFAELAVWLSTLSLGAPLSAFELVDFSLQLFQL